MSVKPLRIFRVDSSKPAIAGMTITVRAYPSLDMADAITQASEYVEKMQSLPPDQHALHLMTPLGENWHARFASRTDAMVAASWMPDEILEWWRKFFTHLKLRGTTLSLIICDDEHLPHGTGPWQSGFSVDLLRDLAVRKVMPAKLAAMDPQRLIERTYQDQAVYALWMNWVYTKKYRAIQRIGDVYAEIFGQRCIVVNYADYKLPIADMNGWAQPVVPCTHASPVSYTGWKSHAHADDVASYWDGGVVYAENELRSQNRSASGFAVPWISYPAFAKCGNETLAEQQIGENDQHRARRIAAWRMNFRSAVRQFDTLIYWERPYVDAESDAVAAEEIKRANREVTRRWTGLPPVKATDAHIVTGDLVICRDMEAA